VVTGAQLLVAFWFQSPALAEGDQIVPAWFGLALLQLAKVPLSWPRLWDLGRTRDDSMWTVVPLMNVGFFWQMMGKTPEESIRQRRIRSWSSQITALGAYRQAALKIWETSSGSVIVGTFTLALSLGWLHTTLADAFAARPVPSEDTFVAEALGGIWFLLALYAAVQWMKRKTATRASWWPVTLWVPVGFLWLAETMRGVPMEGLGLILSGLPDVAFLMIGGATLLPLAVTCWVLVVDDGRHGRSGEGLWARVSERWMGVAAVYGGRDQIVELGFQAVIPGVWFAISYAFADLIAILDSDKAAFTESNRLARGIRQKIFKMLTLGVFLTLTLQLGAASVFHEPGYVASMMITPHLLSAEARILSDVVTVFAAWWCTIAMLVVYFERAELMAAHEAKAASAVTGDVEQA
jgi:hypothetical protein